MDYYYKYLLQKCREKEGEIKKNGKCEGEKNFYDDEFELRREFVYEQGYKSKCIVVYATEKKKEYIDFILRSILLQRKDGVRYVSFKGSNKRVRMELLHDNNGKSYVLENLCFTPSNRARANMKGAFFCYTTTSSLPEKYVEDEEYETYLNSMTGKQYTEEDLKYRGINSKYDIKSALMKMPI